MTADMAHFDDGAEPFDAERVDGAIRVLRRGLAASPDLRRGLPVTVAMGFAATIGSLVLPMLVERMINDGFAADGGIRTGFFVSMTMAGLGVVVAAAGVGWVTRRRLTFRAQQAIAQLRQDAFAKVHNLSVADHNETRRGVLVSRITSDSETLARFTQWGLLAWSIHPVLILGFFVIVAFYSWVIAVVWVICFVPTIPALRWLQRRQLAALDEQRSHIGEMYGLYSEAVSGAGPVRVYGLHRWMAGSITEKVESVRRSTVRAAFYFASTYAAGDVASALAVAATLVVSLTRPELVGLNEGQLVAVLIMATMLQRPIGELGETLDQTQHAIAGWRKILNLIDYEVDVKEPHNGVPMDSGPLAIEAEGVSFHYRDGEPVLRDLDVSIPAGTNVAIVGETGSGKTTFAKLLCRLADPVAGAIKLRANDGQWVDLREMAPEARHASVRMVPQDGFLFDGTIAANVKRGSEGSSDDDVVGAFTRLGLSPWLHKWPDGIHYQVGQRGENLSVGERQLVALARAALADPGLLVLDEATSAVDPETDRALTSALQRLAEGRTMVAIAHRLSTAEQADLILVFDGGRLVEQGAHETLVRGDGLYARMYRAWVGNTRQV